MDASSSLNQLAIDFEAALSRYDKGACIALVQSALEAKQFSVPEIYESVLAKSLYGIANNNQEQAMGIWEEHIQSGIVRTIIEQCYPYLFEGVEEKNTQRPKAMIFCQEEEYHELGARMSTDFFTILGFDAYFIGANTPKESAYEALKALKPKVVSISVTNFYHLAKLQDVIEDLRGFMTHKEVDQFKIIVGGYAIDHTPHAKEKIKADFFIHRFDDLLRIKEVLL